MHWVSWMQVGRRLTCLLAAVSSFASWLLLSTRFSSSSSSCFHCLLAQLKVFFSSFPPSANLGGPSSLPGLLPDSPIAWWLYGHSNYGWHGFRQLNVIPSLLNAILNLCTLCNTWYSIYNSVCCLKQELQVMPAGILYISEVAETKFRCLPKSRVK